MKKYNIILADPPWPYNARNNPNTLFGKGAYGNYSLMKWEDIYKLEIQKIAAENCALFLWTVSPFMPKCLETIERWGFRFITKAFTWIKLDKKGKPRLLTGYYTGSNSEDVYLGLKGRLEVKNKGVNQVVYDLLSKHSRKPDEVKERIVELFGDLPRVELFAREKTEGWDTFGFDIDGKDIREVLQDKNDNLY